MTKRLVEALRKSIGVGSLAMAVMLFAGCGLLPSQGKWTDIDKAAPATEPEHGPDILHPGDILTVNITDIPTPMSPFEVKVREDGKITLLLNKTFAASGKTIGDLETEIRNAYVPVIYKNMTISLRSQNGFYTVEGEVKMGGRQPYLGPTTVLRAISSCGGFTDFANKKKVQLTRGNGHKYIINCIKAVDHPELDLPVYPGDLIHVRRKIW
jgi:protein involved in polysaccharide export with SLBB domain